MLSPPPPWVSTYRTRSLSAVCVIGWGSPCTASPTPVQNAVPQLILFGDHQVGCGGNGDRISRHNAVRDVIFAAAQSTALGPSKEVLGLVPSSLARPADVFLPHWYLGRPAALDVHITRPLQEQTIAEAAFTPGHALQAGVQRKLASNLSACRATGDGFYPAGGRDLWRPSRRHRFHRLRHRTSHFRSFPCNRPCHYFKTPVRQTRHCSVERQCRSLAAPTSHPSPLSGWGGVGGSSRTFTSDNHNITVIYFYFYFIFILYILFCFCISCIYY